MWYSSSVFHRVPLLHFHQSYFLNEQSNFYPWMLFLVRYLLNLPVRSSVVSVVFDLSALLSDVAPWFPMTVSVIECEPLLVNLIK